MLEKGGEKTEREKEKEIEKKDQNRHRENEKERESGGGGERGEQEIWVLIVSCSRASERLTERRVTGPGGVREDPAVRHDEWESSGKIRSRVGDRGGENYQKQPLVLNPFIIPGG